VVLTESPLMAACGRLTWKVGGSVVDVVEALDVVVTLVVLVETASVVLGVITCGKPHSGGVGSTLAWHVLVSALRSRAHPCRHARPNFFPLGHSALQLFS